MKISILLVSLAILFIACGRKESTGDNAGKDNASTAAASSTKRVVIQSKGSDTLVNVAQAFAEEYAKIKSNVAVAVTGGGTGTGIAALINGTVDIANASRELKDKEIEEATKNNHKPVEFMVGHDALAIFLHKNNPLSEITLDQLSKIYAEGGDLEKWSQLGVKVPGCDSDTIVRASRQNNSGTYAYFKEAVLGEGKEFKLGSMDLHGSKDVADMVEKTPCAIGYSGLAYVTPHLKAPCVKKAADAPCVFPSLDSALDKSYPIARPLFMYTSNEPTGEVKAYLDWILSETGQCIMVKEGYAPVRKLTCK